MCNFTSSAAAVFGEKPRCFYCRVKLYRDGGQLKCPTAGCGGAGTDVRCGTCGKGEFTKGPRGVTQCRECGNPIGRQASLGAPSFGAQ